jgi:hypothetical protein
MYWTGFPSISVATYISVKGQYHDLPTYLLKGVFMKEVTVNISKKLLNLTKYLDLDFQDIVNKALEEYLRKRLIICPVTKLFCCNPNIPCNDCDITKNL